MFFEETNNNKTLSIFVQNAVNYKRQIDENEKTDFHRVCLNDSIIIIQEICSNPKDWDINCPLSIGNFGQSFITTLLDINAPFENEEHIDKKLEIVFKYSISLLFEMDFSKSNSQTNYKSISENRLNKILNNLEAYENLEGIGEDLSKFLRNGKFSTAYNLIKALYHSKEINLFLDFSEKHSEACSTLYEIEKQSETAKNLLINHRALLEEKEKKVIALEKTLKEQENAFNFVGLYKGFNDLLKTKVLESRVLLGALVSMGIIMVTPLMYNIMSSNTQSVLTSDITSNFFKLIPFVSLEVLLIYFFRVILQNYKSVKGQILQIELRQTLCQFIQNYAEYSKEIRTTDSHPLEKFENLIFSGIISDAENLPSTFDGMDQITKLLTSLKGK